MIGRYNWRTIYLASLGVLIAAQTLARILFHRHAFHTPRIGFVLHLALVAAWLVLTALIVSRLPERWRRCPVAAIAAILLLGTAHAVASYFDLMHAIWRLYVHTVPPVWLPFTDTGLTLSLLSSTGISDIQIFLIVAAFIALHLLLYVPIAAILTGWARQTMRAPLPRLPRIRTEWAAAAFLTIFTITAILLPTGIRRREVFHKGQGTAFQMAPPALLVWVPPHKGPEPAPTPLLGARPLILIVVDALRRDQMGVYDPARGNTPFLSRLQAEGKLHVARGAYATCSFSFCGIMSVLASQSWNSFTPRPPTLLDALSRHGYRNNVILSGSQLDFGQMANLYGRHTDVLWDQGRKPPADDRMALAKLRETNFPDPRHSFVYLHLMSAHTGALLLPEYREKGATRTAPYRIVYDARVRQSDRMLERAFDILRAKGLLDNALVVITSDHGERIGENGAYFHGGPPDEPTTNIPILVYDAAGVSGWTDRPLTSQIDIAPTFLQAIGGTSLPGWRGTPLQLPAPHAAIPLGTFEATGVIAMIDGKQYKYLCDRLTGRERIYAPGDTPLGKSPLRRALLPQLRPLHLTVAAPVTDPECRISPPAVPRQ